MYNIKQVRVPETPSRYANLKTEYQLLLRIHVLLSFIKSDKPLATYSI